MPTDSDTTVKLLDAKIKMIFDLLKVHPHDDAIGILESVKIHLDDLEARELEQAEAAQKDATTDAEAETSA